MRKPAGPSVKSGAGKAQIYREQSVEERTEAARHAAIALRDFPVLGTGGGSFHIAFVPFQPSELRGYFDHAHNDFAEFMIETGLIGIGLLSAIVLASLYHVLRVLLVRHNRFARGMAFGSLMGIVALMIHSFVDFNLQIFSNSLFFLIILSIPYLVGSRSSRNH
jgi:O-antigen ligase